MMSLPESPRWHLLEAGRLEKQDLEGNRLEIEKQYEHAFYALRTLRHTKIQAARDLFYIDSWLRMEPLPENSHNVRTNRTGTWFQITFELYRQPRCRRAMTAGLIVMSLQQICGVNALAYYSTSTFRDALTTASVLRKDETTQINVLNMKTVNNGTVEMRKDHVALGVSLATESDCAKADGTIVLSRIRGHKFSSGNSGGFPD